MTSFFDRYAAACAAHGIDPCSQKTADMFGVSRSTISAWHTKNTFPNGETVAIIADVLDVTSDYLLGRTEADRSVLSGEVPVTPAPPEYAQPVSFYERFEELCKKKGVKPTRASLDAGGTKGSATYWRNQYLKGVNSFPDARKAQALADYFGVTVDYLLGKSNTKEKPSTVGEELNMNTVIVRGRDGSVTEKKLTNEQVKALQTIIDQLPDAPDDL